MDSYESSYREDFNRARMIDGNYNNPHVYRIRTLTPYADENIRVDPMKYSKEVIQSCDVEDDMLDSFIDRIILNCAMKEAGEEEFGSVKPLYDLGSSPVKRRSFGKNGKQRRSDKKNRRNRRGDRRDDFGQIEGPITQKSNSTGGTITFPTTQFRKMVNAEIESYADRIHAYYQQQYNTLNDDRLSAYRSCIAWKEEYLKLEYLCMKEESEFTQLQETCEALQKELNDIKEAKRKRRSAAKTRKSKKDKGNIENDENKPDDDHAGSSH